MEKIQIDHFKNFKFLSRLKASDDNKLGFITASMDIKDNDYKSDFYTIIDGKTKRMTASGDVTNFQWWDNDSIIFSVMRDKKDKKDLKTKAPFSVYYKLDVTGGEAQEFLRFDRLVTHIYKINDDKLLVVSPYNVYEEQLKAQASSPEELAKLLKEEQDYHVIDELPFWFNGEGFINKTRARLYLYEDGELKPITGEYSSVEDVQIYKDYGYAMFTMNTHKDKMEQSNSLIKMDLDTLEITDISYENDFNHSAYLPISKDEIAIIGGSLKARGLTSNPDFFVLNTIDGSTRMLHDEGDYSLGGMMNSDIKYGNIGFDLIHSDEGFYFPTVASDRKKLMHISTTTGEINQTIGSMNLIEEYVKISDEFYFIGMKDMQGSEIYSMKIGDKPQQLTTLNDKVHDDYIISTPTQLIHTNNDGIDIVGWVIKPTEFDKGKKYPVIMNIHGGPKTVYGPNFIHEMQYWASQGYGVIYCNPRGSDGRGDEFSDIRGKYGTIDYDDLMGFLDTSLKANSWMDGDKLGVTGGSYGGFMTNWMIGHTHRFKAAVSQRSISNWISKSNTTDIGYFFNLDQIGATAWSDHDKIWWHSPLKYADKAKTPTLFIHSREDYRCWIAEGIQMFTALKFFGVDARMCIFEGENHELGRSGKPKHRIRRLKEITEWFDKYLK